MFIDKGWEVRIKVRDGRIDWFAVRQCARWLDITSDAAFRPFVPRDIERAEFGKKIEVAVRKVVVNPIRQCSPVCTLCVTIRKIWNNNARGSAFEPFGIDVIPNMASVIAFI